MRCLSLAAFIATAITGARAWGADGHETVGYIAMNFLSTKALAFVKSSLGTNSSYDESLGPAAPWADSVREEAAYAWSADFHFLDAEDNPPTSCSVVPSRDCSGTCILTAIANYTTRVVDTSLSAAQRQEALKFIDHFIGDIGQPLHVENKEVGGNDISVVCDGYDDNLHEDWDTYMIEDLLEAQYKDSVTTWAANLTARIQSGSYKSLTSNWLACSSTTETTSDGFLACPLVWAQESNAFDCSYVWSYTEYSDICESAYETGAIPIIELQIAKQGYRLAAWLNVLFDGATNLP